MSFIVLKTNNTILSLHVISHLCIYIRFLLTFALENDVKMTYRLLLPLDALEENFLLETEGTTIKKKGTRLDRFISFIK